MPIKATFELPTLSVELTQEGEPERPAVELSMRELCAKYEKLHRGESTIQLALRSLLMEDLQCPVGSRHRYMMQSSAPARARLLASTYKSEGAGGRAWVGWRPRFKSGKCDGYCFVNRGVQVLPGPR
jgi:hypothetical protein